MNNFEKINIEDIEEQKETREPIEAVKNIYRGVWADKLYNGQELPVGGSIFSKELTTKLELDFDNFNEKLNDFTEENIRESYEQNKDSFIEWLNKIGSDVDPYTYFSCKQVQEKMQELLEVETDASINSSERQKIYSREKIPKLSELKGKTECAERAALGQYLLQKVGTESAYVSGIAMRDANDMDELPEDHSFVVLKHPTKEEGSLIFDIARPLSQYNIPRVLETDEAFNYELLKDKNELLVEATEVLQGNKLWFGVGEKEEGQHEISKQKEMSPETIEKLENSGLKPFDKISIILAKGGFKKATEIEFETDGWKAGEDEKHLDGNLLEEFDNFLIEAGLNFEKTKSIEKARYTYPNEEERNVERAAYIYGNSRGDIQKLKKAMEENDEDLMGKMFGFPQTAIDAFKKGEIIDDNDLPKEIKEEDYFKFATSFKMSKEHWREELGYIKKWADFVKEKSPKIYEEYVEMMETIIKEGRTKRKNGEFLR